MFAKLIIVGNLGSDPELRFTPKGAAYARLSVATNRKWADAEGEQHTDTTWFRVTVWGKQAEACNQYLSKGRMVLVEAEQIKASAYLSRDNQSAATLEVVARNVRFLGGNGNGHNGASGTEQPAEEEALAPEI